MEEQCHEKAVPRLVRACVNIRHLNSMDKERQLKKITAKWVGKQVAKKLIHPRRFFHFLRLLKKTKRPGRAFNDAQLKLYSQVLPSGFLHYGHFEDPTVIPEKISLYDIQQAQLSYAELLLAHIVDEDSPVLDIGCGLGGLTELLLQRGFSPVALTPDRFQIQHIRKNYPAVPLIEGKFEDMPAETYKCFFGTVIMAESLQYLNLERALPTMERIVKPEGRWIAKDYFRIGEASEKSGHKWEDFTRKLQEGGWKIVYQQDITQNVLPTLAYLDMWGRRLAFPLFTFLLDQLDEKRPAVSYLVEEVGENIKGYLSDHLDILKPETFSRNKKYMHLVIERS